MQQFMFAALRIVLTGRSLQIIASALLILSIAWHPAQAAEQLRAPIASWSNTCNVSGDYETGQEVCDARFALLATSGWTAPLTFVPDPQTGDGKCMYGPAHYQSMATPYNGFYCPAGFSGQNVAQVSYCSGNSQFNHLPHFKGANASCVRWVDADRGKNAGKCGTCQ